MLVTRVGEASKVQDPPHDQQQLLISLYNRGQFQETLDGAAQLLQHFPNSINYLICKALLMKV